MWYKAMEVAQYIITNCFESEKPVSNLKLQKMLYFVWVDFYKMTNRWLFMDKICAWQLGPVVPEVYYEYSPNAGRPIRRRYPSMLEQCDMKILDDIILNYIDQPANVLVDKTHAPGSAWDIIYQNGLGNRKVIPFDLIIMKEVG